MIRLKWRLTDWPGERGFEKALKRGCQVAGEALRDKMLPFHFTWAAAYKYRYTPRKPGYLKSKAKQGRPPIVLSGLTRAQALASAQVRVQVGGKKHLALKVRFEVPEYAGLRRRDARRVNLARELTSLVESDAEQLVRHIDAVVEMEINYRKQTNARRAAAAQRRFARAARAGALGGVD